MTAHRTPDDDALQPWIRDAACKDVDPAMFFPGRGDSAADALAICKTCPVRQECRTFALGLPPHTPGIWGGTTERERRRIHARHGRERTT